MKNPPGFSSSGTSVGPEIGAGPGIAHGRSDKQSEKAEPAVGMPDVSQVLVSCRLALPPPTMWLFLPLARSLLLRADKYGISRLATRRTHWDRTEAKVVVHVPVLCAAQESLILR